MSPLRLVDPAPSHDRGIELAEDLYRLIVERLPELADDDPVKLGIRRALPALTSALGQSPAAPVA